MVCVCVTQRVLTSLIQTGRDVTTDDYFHIKVRIAASIFLHRKVPVLIFHQCLLSHLWLLVLPSISSMCDVYFQEYFRIPPASLRAVLSSVDVMTVRQILLYYSRNQDTLRVR